MSYHVLNSTRLLHQYQEVEIAPEIGMCPSLGGVNSGGIYRPGCVISSTPRPKAKWRRLSLARRVSALSTWLAPWKLVYLDVGVDRSGIVQCRSGASLGDFFPGCRVGRMDIWTEADEPKRWQSAEFCQLI